MTSTVHPFAPKNEQSEQFDPADPFAHLPPASKQYYTFTPAFIAHIFNRYSVSDTALHYKFTGKPITHGPLPMRISPNVLRQLDTRPEYIPKHFPFSLVAYMLHRIKPLQELTSPLQAYTPAHFEQRRMSRDARIVHISCNRADFSKDNLRKVIK